MSWRFLNWRWIALGVLLLVGFTIWVVRRSTPGPGRSGLSRSSLSEPKRKPNLEAPRAWSLESLPGLTFDEALTLLSSEVESHRKASAGSKPGNLARIEKVATRVGEMHEENLRKIARAAPFYESRSGEARERFEKFRATYDGRWQTLQRSLADLRKGNVDAGEAILSLLRDSGALKHPIPIPEAKDLPRRRLPDEKREPRLTQEEWQAPKKVGMARRDENEGFVERLLKSQTAHAQELDDDLAETPEVKFTAESAPGIQKLLDDEGLRGSPARIANWVRNHIEFVPIWGALQNSITCIENRKGTAMDIASLTIALLRASGIHARYQAGTVLLPIDAAKNWLGNFESAIAASSLLQSGGTPAVVQVGTDGKPVALRFEHVWVRAYVDYIPYQGACHVEGDTWVDIDTSVKRKNFLGRSDVAACLELLGPGNISRDPTAFVQGLVAPATVNPATGELSGLDYGLLDQALSHDRPDVIACLVDRLGDISLAEFAGLGRVVRDDLPVLNPVPAFEVLARAPERSELLDGDRFRVRIRLEANGRTLISHTASAPEIGRSRYSLLFRPVADIDRRIIGDQIEAGPGIPLFDRIFVAGVLVIPFLRQTGRSELVLEGPAVEMGSALTLEVDFDEPAIETAPVRMRIAAGEPTAIGLDLVAVPSALFGSLNDEYDGFGLTTGDVAGKAEDLLEVLLSSVVHVWFSTTDRMQGILASALGCVSHRYPSAGICASKLSLETLFGLPIESRPRGITLDIPGDVGLVLSRDADPPRMANCVVAQGFLGSTLEAKIPFSFFSTVEEPAHWLGTTDALVFAGRSGGTLALIDGENWASVSERLELPAADRQEIADAVEKGLVAMAHLQTIESGLERMSGYALLDPLTGNGAYRISRGLNGAETLNCLFDSKANCDGQPCCHTPSGCGSSVDAFARLWGGAYNSDRFLSNTLTQIGLDLAGDKVPKAGNFLNIISNILGRYTANADLMDSAAKHLGPRAEPLMGLVILFTSLEIMNQAACTLALKFPGCTEIIGAWIGAAQNAAWSVVESIIKYEIRIEFFSGEIDLPNECAELLFK